MGHQTGLSVFPQATSLIMRCWGIRNTKRPIDGLFGSGNWFRKVPTFSQHFLSSSPVIICSSLRHADLEVILCISLQMSLSTIKQYCNRWNCADTSCLGLWYLNLHLQLGIYPMDQLKVKEGLPWGQEMAIPTMFATGFLLKRVDFCIRMRSSIQSKSWKRVLDT